jgi:hypothetical protein
VLILFLFSSLAGVALLKNDVRFQCIAVDSRLILAQPRQPTGPGNKSAFTIFAAFSMN